MRRTTGRLGPVLAVSPFGQPYARLVAVVGWAGGCGVLDLRSSGRRAREELELAGRGFAALSIESPWIRLLVWIRREPEASERRSRREDATNTAATAHTLDDAE
jgi:hypothetical protein